MSAIYNLEPQPTGSVILHTTQGELSVELFAKQTPVTCRNFLQLCVDGYYDNTIFHRLVPGFILQGGDPTGTGHGGESIYDGGALSGDLDPWPMDQRRGRNAGPTGVGFKDEFHSRLKFNRRGLLGMANEGRPDTNGSQFFFTLDKADALTGKNTVFGRVVGDTIYNLMNMAEAEVDEATERPLYPAKVTKVEILVNPFDDIKKRVRTAPAAQKTVVVERKKKRKGGKQLLSFGDEEDGEEELPILKKPKFDTRIVMDVDNSADEDHAVIPSKKKKNKEQLADKSTETSQPATSRRAKATEPERKGKEKEVSTRHYSASPEPEVQRKPKSELERTNEEIAALKTSMRPRTETQPEATKEKGTSALEQMLSRTSVKGGRRRGGRQAVNDDQSSVDFMKGWELKLKKAAQPEKGAGPHATTENNRKRDTDGDDDDANRCDLHFVPNCQSCSAWDKKKEGEESGDEDFMTHMMSCKEDKLGKDLSYRKKAEEELVVIDPRAKAQTIKEQKRAEREARSGNSGREWDQARNAKMARAAAAAGRGAT